MTKEEILQTFGDINHAYNDCTKYDTLKRMLDELTEPCDCINRAELLKAVDTWDKFGCDADSKLVPYKDCYVPYIHYDDVVKAIKGMPSIQPTTKENLVVEDCISRKAVLDALNKWDWQELYLPVHFKDIIDDLPSIQPKPKTGHWISKHIVDDCNGVVLWYECSECGRSIDAPITEEFMLKDYPYCHCGAKMLPTDSEKEWLPQYEGKWVAEKE